MADYICREGRITFRHACLSSIEFDVEGLDSPLRKYLKHFYNSLILQGMKKISALKTGWMHTFRIS